MSARVESLTFVRFRNYERLELHNIGPLTLFVGPNAVGKTNIVEGINLLTSTNSFRPSRARDLVSWGSEQGRLSAHVVSPTRDLTVELALDQQGRTYYLNGKRKAAQDIQGILPSVTFCPDDMTLVKGSQAYRRDALDDVGCQLSRNHRIIRRDYQKLVKHKNTLLKDGVSGALIDSVNDLLVPSAVQLYLYRTALFNNLSQRVSTAYEALSKQHEALTLQYVPSWEDATPFETEESAVEYALSKDQATERLAKAMAARAAEEYRRGRSVVGPHADKVFFYLDGRNASLFGSQGQQRSIALAWKIAEIGLIEEVAGAKPILLLDDVASELDLNRRNALVQLLSNDIQTFITTTDVGQFEREVIENADVYDVQQLRGVATGEGLR